MKNIALCCIVTDKRHLSDHLCRNSNCFHNSSGESDIKQMSPAYISRLTSVGTETMFVERIYDFTKWFGIHSVK